MFYIIASDTMNVDEYLAITEREALELRQQLEQMSAAAELEELYDLLVWDYIEFEATCLRVAVEYSAGRFRTTSDFDDMRRRFNKGLMHVLTLARTYIDCAPRLLARIVESDAARQKFNELTSLEYDARLGYRVMEALRNSAQHHGLPLHGFEAGFVWVPAGDKRKARVHTYSMPTVSLEALGRDSKFKRRVLTELQEIGPSFDIRPMVRDYVAGISKIQFVLRLEAVERTKLARVSVSNAIDRWREVRRQSSDRAERASLYVVDVDNEGRRQNPTPLTLRSCEIFDELRSRNPKLANLNISFVSNSVDEFGSMKTTRRQR